jgi:hypothetical protein
MGNELTTFETLIKEAEMQVNRHKVYENKKFRPKDLSGALISIMDELGIPEDALELSGTFKARNGEMETREIDLSYLAAIRDFEGQITAISLSYPTDLIKGHSKDNSISFCSFEEGILLNVCTNNFPSIQNIMNKLEDQLKLVERLEKPQGKTKSTPVERVERKADTIEIKTHRVRVERKAAVMESEAEIMESTIINHEFSKSPSCFLAYRFNARVKFLAPELSRFLTLLDIKVVSGLGNERRRAAGKGSAQVKYGYDFFIYLITQDDEDTWTKDELSLDYGEGVPVIILVEKGSKTGKEILGGHEYIEFDGDHIGDTFIAILEAINFMKDQKKLAVDQQSGLPED